MHSIESWCAFVDELPDAVLVLKEEQVAYVNPPAARLFGLSADEQPSLEDLFPVKGERTGLSMNTAEKHLQLQCRKADDARFVADVRTRVVQDPESRLQICTLREVMMSTDDQHRFRSAVELFELGLFDHDHVTDE